jgi:glycosyltransferase involved in cell wall biosynthesis
VTSGVLIEAVAAGVPVVATRFPHAVELLADGSGLLVDHQDPAGLAAAIRRIVTEPALAAALAARGKQLATGLRWPAVAAQYEALAQRLRYGAGLGGSPASAPSGLARKVVFVRAGSTGSGR